MVSTLDNRFNTIELGDICLVMAVESPPPPTPTQTQMAYHTSQDGIYSFALVQTLGQGLLQQRVGS